MPRVIEFFNLKKGHRLVKEYDKGIISRLYNECYNLKENRQPNKILAKYLDTSHEKICKLEICIRKDAHHNSSSEKCTLKPQ